MEGTLVDASKVKINRTFKERSDIDDVINIINIIPLVIFEAVRLEKETKKTKS